MLKKSRTLFIFGLCILGCKSMEVPTSSSSLASSGSAYAGSGSLTQGIGQTTQSNLFTCPGGRVTNMGKITSTDNKTWILPGENEFSTGTRLFDLYNECAKITPGSLNQIDTSKALVIEIDADGEIISGFLYGDNYYELYVNGKLVGVDPVPYTPFNSSFVKFRAKRPVQYAIKLIDWEENLGIGSEVNGTNAFYPGDGGFSAKFSDGTITNNLWKAQTFYIAPLSNASCVTESGTSRNSANCTLMPTSAATAYALHWEIPSNWYAKGFDYSSWPAATLYTSAQVGPKTAYTNFTNQFGAAQFIWSSNLVLDNVVLLRFQGK
jgi:hypothetical protein